MARLTSHSQATGYSHVLPFNTPFYGLLWSTRGPSPGPSDFCSGSDSHRSLPVPHRCPSSKPSHGHPTDGTPVCRLENSLYLVVSGPLKTQDQTRFSYLTFWFPHQARFVFFVVTQTVFWFLSPKPPSPCQSTPGCQGPASAPASSSSSQTWLIFRDTEDTSGSRF